MSLNENKIFESIIKSVRSDLFSLNSLSDYELKLFCKYGSLESIDKNDILLKKKLETNYFECLENSLKYDNNVNLKVKKQIT